MYSTASCPELSHLRIAGFAQRVSAPRALALQRDDNHSSHFAYALECSTRRLFSPQMARRLVSDRADRALSIWGVRLRRRRTSRVSCCMSSCCMSSVKTSRTVELSTHCVQVTRSSSLTGSSVCYMHWAQRPAATDRCPYQKSIVVVK